MVARNTNVPLKGRIQMRKTNHLQIVTFGLQRAAGPYRRARLGHQLSALIAKSKATRRRLRNFNLVLVTNPRAGYTSAERPVSIGIV